MMAQQSHDGVDDDEEESWFFGAQDLFDDDDEVADTSVRRVAYELEELKDVMARIARPSSDDNERAAPNYGERTALITANMGNLHLCQLDRGELLRESGAIDSLLSTLMEINLRFPTRPVENNDIDDDDAIELAIAAWGAIRDLACGSIGNRTAIRLFSSRRDDDVNGLELMTIYLKRFHQVTWEEMRQCELDIVTATIGAIRTVTHKTPENCQPLHDSGASSLLVWRLLHGSSDISNSTTSLPDQLVPYREACFRAAVSLINIAGECEACAYLCGTNAKLVSILIESWGSNKRLSHTFRNILESAKEQLAAAGEYDSSWGQFLH